MPFILRVVVIVTLLLHGLRHGAGFLAAWTEITRGFSDRPSVLFRAMSYRSELGQAFGLLWLAALIGFCAAAVGLVAGQVWWPQVAIAAAVVSLACILPWWYTVTPGLRYGAALLDVLILVALLPEWRGQVLAIIGS